MVQRPENGSLLNEIHQPDDSGWVCVSAILASSMYGWLSS